MWSYKDIVSPIPVKELRQRGQAKGLPRPGTHPDLLLAFLRKNLKDAWRASELSKELGLDAYTIGSVLRRLQQRDLIDKLDEHWFALDDREVAKRQAARATNRLANEKWGPERAADWPTARRR